MRREVREVEQNALREPFLLAPAHVEVSDSKGSQMSVLSRCMQQRLRSAAVA